MDKTPSNIRQWSISISIALLAILGLVLAALLFMRSNQNQMVRTVQPYANNVLSPPRPALSFNLLDQHGAQISLETFGANPILITFLYTNCTKACPITAGKLHQLVQLLDKSNAHTEIVTISVDPIGDSITSAYTYSKQWKMENDWHYLTGSLAQLKPIWEYYWAEPTTEVTNLSEIKTSTENTDAEAIQGYISHSPPLFLVVNNEIRVAMSNANFEPNLFIA